MNKKKLTALLLAAVTGCTVFSSCSSKKEKSSESSSVSEDSAASTAEKNEPFDSESYKDIIKKDIELAETSDEPLELGTIGEELEPKEEIEKDLGNYRMSENGVKLYFDEKYFPKELMLTLEQYFISLANADFTTYSRITYPDYYNGMNEYLQKEYSYDIRESFANQCSSLANTMNGKFTVSRIKLDPAPNYYTDKDNLETYFKNFDDILGSDFYQKLKKKVDKVYDGEFFIMAEDRLGNEKLLIKEYEIVFVEVDGRYYVFG